MNPRRQGRELALRVLFAAPGGQDPDRQLAYGAAEMGVGTRGERFAALLVAGVRREQPAIDRRLAAASRNWTLDQMGEVERTILRLAAYEMGPGGTPVRVAINEAVELAKAYAGPEAAQFVNGVLGRLAAEPAGEPDADPPGR